MDLIDVNSRFCPGNITFSFKTQISSSATDAAIICL